MVIIKPGGMYVQLLYKLNLLGEEFFLVSNCLLVSLVLQREGLLNSIFCFDC